jgi:general secretion pathway protein H
MKTSRIGIWSRKPHAGFTFLEIVIVLFILGLLLLLTYPKVQSLTEDGLQKASRHLVNRIQHVYYETISTRKIHRLRYDLQSNKYWVDIQGSEGVMEIDTANVQKGNPLPQGVVFQDIVTLRQGKVTEGQAFTHFYPLGLAEKTVIHLADRHQRVTTLDVNPLTGRVKIYEGYVEIKKSRR